MANAKFCDICGKAFPERQTGSVSLQITASYGFTPDKRDLDICKDDNPFLRIVKDDLDKRLAIAESMAKNTRPLSTD